MLARCVEITIALASAEVSGAGADDDVGVVDGDIEAHKAARIGIGGNEAERILRSRWLASPGSNRPFLVTSTLRLESTRAAASDSPAHAATLFEVFTAVVLECAARDAAGPRSGSTAVDSPRPHTGGRTAQHQHDFN